MADDHVRLLIERVNLRTLLVSIILAAVGLAALVASRSIDAGGYHKTGVLFQEGGAALFIAMVLAVVWEFAGKRAFADEILAKANMSRDLAEAGIKLATDSFKDERINWDELFRNGCRLDMFVAYASTWRNTQVERIEKFLSEEGARIRIILPDPDDTDVVEGLSKRFETVPDDVRRLIGEAKAFFEYRERKRKVSWRFTLLP
jgi:hypothetical protein